MIVQLRDWFNEMLIALVLFWVFGSTIYHNHFDKNLLAIKQELQTNEFQKKGGSDDLVISDQKRKQKRDLILQKKDRYLVDICVIGLIDLHAIDLNKSMSQDKNITDNHDISTVAIYVNLEPLCSIFSKSS